MENKELEQINKKLLEENKKLKKEIKELKHDIKITNEYVEEVEQKLFRLKKQVKGDTK